MENESAPVVIPMCNVLAAFSGFLPLADVCYDEAQNNEAIVNLEQGRQTLENVLCPIIKRGISQK